MPFPLSSNELFRKAARFSIKCYSFLYTGGATWADGHQPLFPVQHRNLTPWVNTGALCCGGMSFITWFQSGLPIFGNRVLDCLCWKCSVRIQNRAPAPFSLVKSEVDQKAQGFWTINETEWEEFRLVRFYVVDFEKCMKYSVRSARMGLSRGKTGSGAGSFPLHFCSSLSVIKYTVHILTAEVLCGWI